MCSTDHCTFCLAGGSLLKRFISQCLFELKLCVCVCVCVCVLYVVVLKNINHPDTYINVNFTKTNWENVQLLSTGWFWGNSQFVATILRLIEVKLWFSTKFHVDRVKI